MIANLLHSPPSRTQVPHQLTLTLALALLPDGGDGSSGSAVLAFAIAFPPERIALRLRYSVRIHFANIAIELFR